MTYSIKSLSSSEKKSGVSKTRKTGDKPVNPPNAVPRDGQKYEERHLYGGMLYPAHWVSRGKSGPSDGKVKHPN